MLSSIVTLWTNKMVFRQQVCIVNFYGRLTLYMGTAQSLKKQKPQDYITLKNLHTLQTTVTFT